MDSGDYCSDCGRKFHNYWKPRWVPGIDGNLIPLCPICYHWVTEVSPLYNTCSVNGLWDVEPYRNV